MHSQDADLCTNVVAMRANIKLLDLLAGFHYILNSLVQENTLIKKVRARGQFFGVISLAFLYRDLCLCFYSPYMGRSTPTTAFNGTICYFKYKM